MTMECALLSFELSFELASYLLQHNQNSITSRLAKAAQHHSAHCTPPPYFLWTLQISNSEQTNKKNCTETAT